MDDSHLPIELCERIIDLAGCEAWRGAGVILYGPLYACCLVCQAWFPRARYNLYFRVVLRTARHLKLFLDVATTGPQPREMDLVLPLETARRRGKDQLDEASLASPLLTVAARRVRVLSLSYSKWLYPRAYIGLLAAHFAAVTTLTFDHVTFATGGDLARMIWSLPHLRDVFCRGTIVKHGGMLRMPTITSRDVPSQSISSVNINGCSSMAPFIIKTVTTGSSNVEHLWVRSSFARWAPDDFATFSAFVRLRTLHIGLASPTVFSESPLPTKSSLLEVYSKALSRILWSIASTDTCNDGLREIDIACEPGLGSWRHLCGQDKQDGVKCPREKFPRTYEQKRSTAMAMLLEGMEDILLDKDELKRPFVGLCALNISVWDTCKGKDDEWWLTEVVGRLPALHTRGVLSVKVARTDDGNDLWNVDDK